MHISERHSMTDIKRRRNLVKAHLVQFILLMTIICKESKLLKLNFFNYSILKRLIYITLMVLSKMKQKAMKIMNSEDGSAANELELLWDISHDNIVRYFDHFQARISDCNHIFLITEFCQVAIIFGTR